MRAVERLIQDRLFERPGFGPLNYDVSADGRFLMVEPIEPEGEPPKPSIRITQNWYEEFRDREQD